MLNTKNKDRNKHIEKFVRFAGSFRSSVSRTSNKNCYEGAGSNTTTYYYKKATFEILSNVSLSMGFSKPRRVSILSQHV